MYKLVWFLFVFYFKTCIGIPKNVFFTVFLFKFWNKIIDLKSHMKQNKRL